MFLHPCARSCPRSRALLVQRVRQDGWTVARAAEAAGLSERTAYKWLSRFDEAGEKGLIDRSSRPRRSPGRTPQKLREEAIELRRQAWTGRQISRWLKLGRSTVSRILRAARLSRARDLKPKRPENRYEHPAPGDLLHVDIKKLARFWRAGHRVTGSRQNQSRKAGWEYVHVCVDDHSRLAYVEVLPSEKASCAVPFMRRAMAWFRSQGIDVKRVMTDNGSCYRSKRFRQLLRDQEVRHVRTKPYTPRTNGKAERFIKTLQNEWAYAVPYENADQRAEVLPTWVEHYNHFRPHHSLGELPPISRRPEQAA